MTNVSLKFEIIYSTERVTIMLYTHTFIHILSAKYINSIFELIKNYFTMILVHYFIIDAYKLVYRMIYMLHISSM